MKENFPKDLIYQNKSSLSAIALFKYLQTFPWLLQIADTGFDAESAQKIHLGIAAREMIACLIALAKLQEEERFESLLFL